MMSATQMRFLAGGVLGGLIAGSLIASAWWSKAEKSDAAADELKANRQAVEDLTARVHQLSGLVSANLQPVASPENARACPPSPAAAALTATVAEGPAANEPPEDPAARAEVERLTAKAREVLHAAIAAGRPWPLRERIEFRQHLRVLPDENVREIRREMLAAVNAQKLRMDGPFLGF
jgi:hypothetical protein